jgi:hypothetical protein
MMFSKLFNDIYGNQGPDPLDFRHRSFYLDLPDLSPNRLVELKLCLENVRSDVVSAAWTANTIVVHDVANPNPVNVWIACLRGGGICDIDFASTAGKHGIHLVYQRFQTTKKWVYISDAFARTHADLYAAVSKLISPGGIWDRVTKTKFLALDLLAIKASHCQFISW